MKIKLNQQLIEGFDSIPFNGIVDIHFADGRVYEGAKLENDTVDIPFSFFSRIVKVIPYIEEKKDSKTWEITHK